MQRHAGTRRQAGALTTIRVSPRRSERGRRACDDGADSHAEDVDGDGDGNMTAQVLTQTDPTSSIVATTAPTGHRRLCPLCGMTFGKAADLRRHQTIHTGEKPFGCLACGKRFRLRSYLASHQRTHTGEKPFSCTECGRSFSDRSDRNAHQRSHHAVYSCSSSALSTSSSLSLKPPAPSHACAVCSRRFAKPSALRRHETTHEGPETKRHTCRKCGRTFRHSGSLSRHETALHSGSRASGAGGVGIDYRSDGSEIGIGGADTGSGGGKCGVIGSGLRDAAATAVSTATATSPIDPTASPTASSCSECGREFRNAAAMARHVAAPGSCHEPHVCRFCGKRFARPSVLLRHMRTHTGERPFMCTECGRAFTQKAVMVKHRRVHWRQRLLATAAVGNSANDGGGCVVGGDFVGGCGDGAAGFVGFGGHVMGDRSSQDGEDGSDICGNTNEIVATPASTLALSAASRSTLPSTLSQHCLLSSAQCFSGRSFTQCSYHISTQSLQPSPYASIPSTASQSSTTSSSISASSSSSYPSVLSSDGYGDGSNWKSHPCEDCGRVFADRAYLVYHRRTHTGERPYVCEECGKQFRHSSNLSQHRVVHSGIKAFKCEECGKTFARSSFLKVHARVHTGEKPYRCTECSACFAQQAGLKQHARRHLRARGAVEAEFSSEPSVVSNLPQAPQLSVFLSGPPTLSMVSVVPSMVSSGTSETLMVSAVPSVIPPDSSVDSSGLRVTSMVPPVPSVPSMVSSKPQVPPGPLILTPPIPSMVPPVSSPLSSVVSLSVASVPPLQSLQSLVPTTGQSVPSTMSVSMEQPSLVTSALPQQQPLLCSMVVVPLEEVMDEEEMEDVDADVEEEIGQVEEMSYQRLAMLFGHDETT